MNLTQIAGWLGQNWLSVAAVATLLVLVIFAPSVLGFLGHAMQIFFQALPTPAKAMIGLVLVLMLGLVFFNYTIGAQYVCLPDTGEVGVVGYVEGVMYRFGNDVVGVNKPTYDPAVDKKSLAVGEVQSGAGVSTVQETNLIQELQNVQLSDGQYKIIGVVGPPNQVGSVRGEQVALLQSKELMFKQRFGANYALFDVCINKEKNTPRYNTCYMQARVVNTRDRSYMGSGVVGDSAQTLLSVEDVLAAPVCPDNDNRLFTQKVKPVYSIWYSTPGVYEDQLSGDVYKTDYLWVSVHTKQDFFLQGIEVFAGWFGSSIYPKLSDCQPYAGTLDNASLDASGLYGYAPYSMELKGDAGLVYNAAMGPLAAQKMTDSNGNVVITPVVDLVDLGFERATKWHDALMGNITKHVNNPGDVMTYTCTADRQNVTMRVMGIDFFDKTVLVAIFILTGIIVVYGWIMRL